MEGKSTEKGRNMLRYRETTALKKKKSLGARRSLVCSRIIIVIFRANTVPSALLPLCHLT